MSVPPPMPESPEDSEHIRLLVIFQYIYAGLSGVGLLFLVGHFFLMSFFFQAIEDAPIKSSRVEPGVEVEKGGPMDIPEEITDADIQEFNEVDEAGAASETGEPEVSNDAKKLFGSMRSIMFWFYGVFGAILLLTVVLNIMSGLKMTARRGRVFSILTGGLNCLSLPLGTILGIFTIVVLNRQSVVTSYRSQGES